MPEIEPRGNIPEPITLDSLQIRRSLIEAQITFISSQGTDVPEAALQERQLLDGQIGIFQSHLETNEEFRSGVNRMNSITDRFQREREKQDAMFTEEAYTLAVTGYNEMVSTILQEAILVREIHPEQATPQEEQARPEPVEEDTFHIESPSGAEHEIFSSSRGLEANILHAIARIDVALQSPEEQALREHQLSMLADIETLLLTGEHAGYIDAATGVGKTRAMVKLAQMLNVKTLIVSTTLPIADHTFAEAQQYAPTLTISRYDGRYKDSSGTAINTTLPSALGLVERPPRGFNPEEIELLIVDEGDLGLGERQHTIYNALPNALKFVFTATPQFDALQGLIKRGLVTENTEWIGMFRNLAHRLSLEEAIARGILVPPHIHMHPTHIVVDNIVVTASGEYRQSDVERLTTQIAANAQAVGMIAGIEQVPPDVQLDDDIRQDIIDVHEQIAGKRTSIFCASITHANQLAAMLTERGISAAPIHSDLSGEINDQTTEAFKRGDIQVITGVRQTARGFDVPATEVTIHMVPHYSARDLIQEFGRGSRQSPETGKERLFAIQFMYQFRHRSQEAVSLFSIFDPDFILHGREYTGRTTTAPRTRRERPLITISGIELRRALQESRGREFIRSRFTNANAKQMSDYLEFVTEEFREQYPEANMYHLCQYIAESVPERVPIESHQIAINAMRSDDEHMRATGRNAFLLLNMKSLMTVADSYIFPEEDSSEEQDEIMHTAISSLVDVVDRIKPYQRASVTINRPARQAIAEYISRRDGIPEELVLHPQYRLIKVFGDTMFGERITPFSEEELEELTQELLEELPVDEELLREYLSIRNGNIDMPDVDMVVPSDTTLTEDRFEFASLQLAIKRSLQELTEREQQVIELRFIEDRTLEETAKALKVTRERVRQIEERAIRKLRMPSSSRQLRDFS